uniref:G-type lectin S-receptor-like serine/threonine-protein kinase At2g19130 n=1 Tax=Tanacetum cinerariifolium TaxID=118510 RepID=A0A6L2LTU4_TANCI|nr:G-type lectin S-receptor-like serine/threonine-protein kinase At2g19130 [Tanacetum cinerariifolium]
MALMLLLCFSMAICFTSAADTISANHSLSGDQTITSKHDNFVLGFFKAGNSSNYYVGIWYKKVASNPPTVVWVANREMPISDRFNSELKIIDGNLVLLNEFKLQIWSTNVTTTNLNSVIAVIHDDGNLVLTDGSNSVEPVWQSFDHPVNTLLPGAKLAYDFRTNKKQLLTSWKSEENPEVGLFSLELDPTSKEYIGKWNGSHQYWTSGAWNGHIFSLVPEMTLNFIYNFSFISNENESYFTYSVYNPSIISRFIMDVSGQVQQHTWFEPTRQWVWFWSRPKTQCEVYALCGAFGTCRQTGLSLCNCLTGFKPRSESDWNQSDFSGGCVRKTELQCGRNEGNSNFIMIKVRNLPSNKFAAAGSAGECHAICMNNCSCNAYSFAYNECSLWDGELLDLTEDDANGKTIYIKVASKDIPIYRKKNCFPVGTVAGSVVVTGKRNAEQSKDSYYTFFPSSAANVLIMGGDILSLLDSRLNRDASIEEVTKVLKVAYWCIQDEEDSRPSMSLVERILEGVSDVNMPPIPQSVKFFVDNKEHVFFTELSSKLSSQVQSTSPSGDSQSKSASS